MNRKEILETAITTVCKERQDAYGNCEDNFALIAKLWSDYTESEITAKDVAMMMILLKMARIKTGNYKADNYVDIAGYAACGGEVAAVGTEQAKVAAVDTSKAQVATSLPQVSTRLLRVDAKAEQNVESLFKPPAAPKQPKKACNALNLDIGKIKALRKAGWTLAKIADEMRCSTQTIANHLARAEREGSEATNE